MPVTPAELEALIHLAYSYNGRTIKIDESISRSRDTGHNHHFATHTFFTLPVQNVMATMSGAQLIFSGPNGRYGLSLDSVTSYTQTDNTLQIIEQFEQQTERRTTITADPTNSKSTT